MVQKQRQQLPAGNESASTSQLNKQEEMSTTFTSSAIANSPELAHLLADSQNVVLLSPI